MVNKLTTPDAAVGTDGARDLRAVVLRTQLARPENGLLGPDKYNQLFTTHGTTMMFLFAVPVMNAMGLYFVPLMVGTRDVAFPRLNAFGYWNYLVAVVFLYVSLFANNLTNAHPDLALANNSALTGLKRWLWTDQTLRPRTVGVLATYRF